MIARLDHHPMLTALLALTTAVLFVVVITFATLLITSAPASSPSSVGDGGNAGDAAPANLGAGAAASHGSYDIYSHSRTGDGGDLSSISANDPIERHAKVVAAYQKSR